MNIREFIPKNMPVPKDMQNMRVFQDEMNRLIDDFFGAAPRWWHGVETAFGATAPAVDVTETDKGFVITAEVPGLDVKDVTVTAGDGYLTIKGEKKEEIKEEKKGFFRQERAYGMFQRMIDLPVVADLGHAEATVSRGVLTIRVPRKANAAVQEHVIDIRHAA